MEFKGTKGKWKGFVFGNEIIIESKDRIHILTMRTSVSTATEKSANAQLIAHAPEMYEKHYEEIEILEDILKNNPTGNVAFKLRMIIESKKDLLTRATTI